MSRGCSCPGARETPRRSNAWSPLCIKSCAAWRAAIFGGEAPGHSLQATALVHEVYLRLVDVDRMTLKNRAHFYGVAAVLMRQILVDHARRQRADKRGGGVTMVSLDDVSPATQPASVDVLALDQALEALSALDARQCRVVELRFFAGLDVDETADALEISPATVARDWALAKVWLYRRLSSRE